MQISLFNTKTHQKELFVPLKKNKVSMYCCGPTVYSYAHIGNLRTFITADFWHRVFRANGFEVVYCMNITDVGHLTGDNDYGEDKMLKAGQKEKKTVWQIADFYTQSFLKDIEKLHILRPKIICKATEHIKQQIEMIERLEKKGYTYQANGNVYFSVDKYPQYGQLGNIDLDAQTKSRVDSDQAKKNPRDFVLWFTKSKFEEQAMKWPSPWGVGYPGWHIECSAMSTHYLGNHFDIHLGGEDLQYVHHNNEIAQSCCANDGNFVNYWIHGKFLIIPQGKMSKSTGNFATLQSVCDMGFEPVDYRFLCLLTHYRKQMLFTLEALTAAKNAYQSIKQKVQQIFHDTTSTKYVGNYRTEFMEAINDDLNLPKALSIFQRLLDDSDVGNSEKQSLVLEFDSIFGLQLADLANIQIPEQVNELVQKRLVARQQKDFATSDELRKRIEAHGFLVKDNKDGSQQILKK